MSLLTPKIGLSYRYSVGGIGIQLETHFRFGRNASPVRDSLSKVNESGTNQYYCDIFLNEYYCDNLMV
jgi:hypothetical protein